MRLVLTKVEAKILLDFFNHKEPESFIDCAILASIFARLEEVAENESD